MATEASKETDRTRRGARLPIPGVRTLVVGTVVGLIAVGGGILWWKKNAREREIEQLRAAIRNLTASYPVARLVALEQAADADGKKQTRMQVEFVDSQGRRRGGPLEATLAGSRIYFEALLIVFDDPLVERGQRRSMAFPTRLFSEVVAPEAGVKLTVLDAEGVPTVYDQPEQRPDDLSPEQYRRVLARFWHYANSPAEAAALGIQVMQGQAVFTEYQVRRYYDVFVEADGGLTIRPEHHWLEKDER